MSHPIPPDPATTRPLSGLANIPNALRLLVILTAAVAVAEARTLAGWDVPETLPAPWLSLAHILITTLLVFPVIYLLAYRPLLAEIVHRQRAEAELHKANLEMEQRVELRTAELTAANQALQKEVAERRRAEDQLRLQTTAVEAAANGIVVTDRQGSVEWCNPAFSRMTGYSRAESLGKSLRLLKSGQHPPEFYQELWQTVLAGKTWQGELVNRRKDGSLYTEEQIITPVLDENGQLAHFIAIKQDISQRKQAEFELQQASLAEHRQRQLAESLVQASLAFGSSLKPDEVLDRILEQAQMVIPCSVAAVLLLEQDTIYLSRYRGVKGRPPGLQRLESGMPLDKLAHTSAVIRQGKPALVTQAELEPEWSFLPGLEWVRAAILAPLASASLVSGVIILASEQADFFEAGQLPVLQAFATHAVMAIQNARLFSELDLSRARLQELTRRLVAVQEEERRTIARELHDEAGQALTALKLGLGLLERELDAPPSARLRLAELSQTTEQVMSNLHNLAIDLRPASLEFLGLETALQQYLNSVQKNHGLQVQFESLGFSERLPFELETTLYRLVQEALTNVLRHANASQADVLLERRDGKIILIVEDNGSGFSPEQVRQTGHLGLFGMRERVEMFNGQLTIESQAGSGTTLCIEIPYAD